MSDTVPPLGKDLVGLEDLTAEQILQILDTAEAFFERFFVHNYCPLVFLEESGRNRTPDKLPKAERDHAWFAGYAPADDPRIAFAVVVELRNLADGFWHKTSGFIDVSIVLVEALPVRTVRIERSGST